jgi:hypothetical protein
MMRMCAGDGKGVGGVGRKLAGPGQQNADHRLDLLLFGMAVAGQGLLNPVRRIFADRNSRLRERKHGGTARLPQFQSRSGVFVDESFFDRGFIGRETFDNRLEPFGKLIKPGRHRQSGIGIDASCRNERQMITALRHNPPAGVPKPGIYSKEGKGPNH